MMAEEMKYLTGGHFAKAAELFDQMIASDTLDEFLTLKAYELLD